MVSDFFQFIQHGRADAADRHADDDHGGLGEETALSDEVPHHANDDTHDKGNDRYFEVLRDENKGQSAEDRGDHVG